MQLFLPSLLAIVAVAIFAFAVVPQFGPLSLAVVSLLALVGAGVHHYIMFKEEYERSTWQNTIRDYSGYITLGVAILVCIFFLLQLRSSLFSSKAANTGAAAGAAGAIAGAAGAAAAAVSGVTNALNSAALSLTGPPPAVPALPAPASTTGPTILEQATDAATKSLNAMRQGAEGLTNPIVAAVNRGLNAVLPGGPPGGPSAPQGAPARNPITPLPFSPSEV